MNVTQKTVSLICLASVHLFCQVVSLHGTITETSGKPVSGARVSLVQQNITTTTDSNGDYTLTAIPTPASPRQSQQLPSQNATFRLSGNNLEVTVYNSSQPIVITLMSLTGRVVDAMRYSPAANGVYQFPLGKSVFSRGVYLITATAGGSRWSLKTTRISGNQNIVPAIYPMQKASFRTAFNTQAAFDTLTVFAKGYQRGERRIDSLTGRYDFSLHTVTYTDVYYKTGTLSQAEQKFCKLDVHVPQSGSNWPVVVWFHGGGVVEGDKTEGWTSYHNNFAYKFLDAGLCMVMPDYRLINQGGDWPNYIEDAAAAAVWVRKNIECYGADPKSVFIAGFSAGAYLTFMLALDTTYVTALQYPWQNLCGFIPMSGQTQSHSNIAGDLGIDASQMMTLMPQTMPQGHIRKLDKPLKIFVGDGEGQTITDNQKLYNDLIAAGSNDVFMEIVAGRAHSVNPLGNDTSPERDHVIAFIKKYRTP